MTATIPMIALPRDAYHHLIFTLRTLLPPLADTPEAIVRRDHAAIAQVAALCPANAAQAALAAQHVAANEQAMECLRASRDPATSREAALRCTAQAASMMRQSQGALRLLLRAQEVTAKRAADGTAAWAEHCAEQWMMQALRPDPEGDDPEASENPEQSLTQHHHETPPPRDQSQEPGQYPTHHYPETNPAPPHTDDHDTRCRPTPHHPGTKAGTSGESAPSRHTGPPLTHQDSETHPDMRPPGFQAVSAYRPTDRVTRASGDQTPSLAQIGPSASMFPRPG